MEITIKSRTIVKVVVVAMTTFTVVKAADKVLGRMFLPVLNQKLEKFREDGEEKNKVWKEATEAKVEDHNDPEL